MPKRWPCTKSERTVSNPTTTTKSKSDRLVVDENAQSQDELEPRTKRAVAEAMDISLLSKGGRYEVQSASGIRYEVELDSSARLTGRVDASLEDVTIGAAFPDQTAGSQLTRTKPD
jgi:hypothetical protein